MIKMEIEEFLFEIKNEMICYDELGCERYDIWKEHFERWLDNNDIKKKNVKKDKNKICYTIKDESEIFEIVDEYYYAVIEKREDEYFSRLNEHL